MTKSSPPAARYFPFRAAPDATRVVRDTPGTDGDGQRRAVRFDTVHTTAMGAARALWLPPPILLPFSIGTSYWIEGLIVTAVCAVAIAVLYRVAAHVRDEVRLLDSAIGIPIPDDVVKAVAATSSAMDSFKEIYDQGVDDDIMAERLRPHVRQLQHFDQLYVKLLHDSRRRWVRGDFMVWRETAGQLPVVANGVAQLLENIVAR